MKILIVGEFSGVAKGLKKGFEQFDYVVDIISDDDGFKNISGKKRGSLQSSKAFRWGSLILDAVKNLNVQYDLTIFLSPFIFKFPLFLNDFLYSTLISKSKKTVLLACTSDSVWCRDYPICHSRSSHLGHLEDNNWKPHRFYKDKYYKSNINLISMMDSVFALASEFQMAYQKTLPNIKLLHFPYETEENFSLNESRKYAYHGITRRGFKGTRYIINFMEAFHDSDLEILITERISFLKFKENLLKSHIYFDQMSSRMPAMSSLNALNFVPYVVTGIQRNIDGSHKEYFDDCPAFDLINDVELIMEAKSNTSNYDEVIAKNIEFLKKYHDPKNICENILNSIY